MADIQLGIAFWAYAVFAFLLLITTRSIDSDWMWFAIAGEPRAPTQTKTGQAAAEQGLTGCPTCGLIHALHDNGHNHSVRCGGPLHMRSPKSLQRTMSLLITATIFYIPANIYPIMTTTNFGQENNSTIMGGPV